MNLRASLPLLASAVLAASCVKQSGSIEIFQACSPPTPSSTGGCTYPTGQCTAIPLDTYLLDVDSAFDFFVAVEVHNQLLDNADANTGGGNTHIAYVDSYSVSYSAPIAIPDTGGPIQNAVPTAGSAVMGVRLVDGDAMVALYNQLHGTTDVLRLTADLKLSGKLGDQKKFETAPRTFGIDVCAGCTTLPTCDAGKELFFCPGPGQYPSTHSCGGSSGSSFAIGGTISGLTGAGLVLGCTGLSDLTVSAGVATFQFSGSVPDGTDYTCVVVSQPAGPQCTIANPTGTVSGADVSLSVSCS